MASEREENRWTRLDPSIVVFACDAFLKGHSAQWIATEIRSRFKTPMHRTQVYRVLAEARDRGYFALTPPRDKILSERMMDRFVRSRRSTDERARNRETGNGGNGNARADERKYIKVVPQGSVVSLDLVAAAAAKTALYTINRIYARMTAASAASMRPQKASAVHVGFGAGETMRLVARHLAELLRAQTKPPPLVLHALGPGSDVKEPATAPVAFFNFFDGIPNVSFVGLFASAFVNDDDWDRMREHIGVREAFARKPKIQVVITALAAHKDEHGELNRLLENSPELGRQTRLLLDGEEGRVGDVLFRPFTKHQPIRRKAGIRAVSLFELDELVEFAANKDKAVILVAGPCGKCHKSRSDALLPLLQEPALDVWSHLITDSDTASRCLDS